MVSIIIRIFRINYSISIGIGANQIRRYFFDRSYFSIKIKNFVTSWIYLYKLFCFWNRYIWISSGNINISNLYLINTIFIGIIWVFRIRHIYKGQVSFSNITCSSRIRREVLLFSLSSRFTSHYFYLIRIRSTNYFFTHLPLPYITVRVRICFRTGRRCCFSKFSFRKLPNANRDVMELIKSNKDILRYIRYTIIIIINIWNVSKIIRIIISIYIYRVRNTIIVIITTKFWVEWELIFTINDSVSICIWIVRVSTFKFFYKV